MNSVGIKSLAVVFPDNPLTNEDLERKFPEIVATAKERALAKLWSKGDGDDHYGTLYNECLAPYITDPFRGAKTRYVLQDGRKMLDLEVQAVQTCLRQANTDIKDIDFVLVSSFLPDQGAVGNAAWLAAKLNIQVPCLNFETSCNGTLFGMILFSQFAAINKPQKFLLVCSTANHRQLDQHDTLRWFLGDGACALLLERMPGTGFLGFETINTIETNGMFYNQPALDALQGMPCNRTSAHPKASEMARTTAGPYLRKLTEGALLKGGVKLQDVDNFVFHTPAVHYADFCGKVLNLQKPWFKGHFEKYGNVGNCNLPYNLIGSMNEIKEGNIVLLHAVGSSSTSSVGIYRMGTKPITNIQFG